MINRGWQNISLAIDSILHYGYESNHVSALISITSSGSILVSRVTKTYAGFAILHSDEHQQVLQIIYMSDFVDYLQGKAANWERIQNVALCLVDFCHHKINQQFGWIVILLLRFVCFRHGACTQLCFRPFC